jgi:hypothetical protein
VRVGSARYLWAGARYLMRMRLFGLRTLSTRWAVRWQHVFVLPCAQPIWPGRFRYSLDNNGDGVCLWAHSWPSSTSNRSAAGSTRQPVR